MEHGERKEAGAKNEGLAQRARTLRLDMTAKNLFHGSVNPLNKSS